MSTKAYFPAKPGDPILAETWNNLQTTIRAAIDNLDARLAGTLSITGVDSSGPIWLTGSGVIQHGGDVALADADADLGLYAGDGRPIRLVTRGASVQIFADASDAAPAGTTPNLEVKADGDATIRGRLTAGGLTVSGGTTRVADLTATKISATEAKFYKGLYVTGGITCVQDLVVDYGATRVNALTATNFSVNATEAKFYKGLTVSGGTTSLWDLTASGMTTLSSGLTVSNGFTSVQDLTARTIQVSTSARLHGGLEVSTSARIQGGLSVSDYASIHGGLTITKKGLTVTSGTTSVQALTASGLTTLNNGLSVSGGTTSVQALTATEFTVDGRKIDAALLRDIERRLAELEGGVFTLLIHLPLTQECPQTELGPELTLTSLKYKEDSSMGGYAYFGGNDSRGLARIDCPSTFTLSTHIRLPSQYDYRIPSTKHMPFISFPNGPTLSIYDKRELAFCGGQKQIFITDSTWTHVAATYDGYELSLYINGEHKTSSKYTLNAENNYLYIGSTPQEWFVGNLAQVRIYRGALPDAAISRIARIKNL